MKINKTPTNSYSHSSERNMSTIIKTIIYVWGRCPQFLTLTCSMWTRHCVHTHMNLAVCELSINLALFTLTVNLFVFTLTWTWVFMGWSSSWLIWKYLRRRVRDFLLLISHVSSGNLRARLFVFAAKSQDPKRTKIRAFR